MSVATDAAASGTSAIGSRWAGLFRGSAFGLLADVQSFGNLVASALAGIIWTAASSNWAFALLGAAMVLATVLLASAPTARGSSRPGDLAPAGQVRRTRRTKSARVGWTLQ